MKANTRQFIQKEDREIINFSHNIPLKIFMHKIGFVANTVPAKLQGYMSAGKPILASIDGGAKEIIEESNCGLVVPAGDSNSYAKILDEFIDNIDKYRECGINAKEYFNKNFEKKIVMDKLEKLLEDLAQKKEG